MQIHKKAIVVHSGGMDSSICLKLAIDEFGAKNILSLGFNYNQRHSPELTAAEKICRDWQVDRFVIDIKFLSQITTNSLTDHQIKIKHSKNKTPNSLVSGRNGLMARIASIHADSLKANYIYMGVMELEEANSGYRDCNRRYIDIIQKALRIDFNNQEFEIRTPIIKMNKEETMKLCDELGVLDYLLENTITCYEGKKGSGCKECPACLLRNEGIENYRKNQS